MKTPERDKFYAEHLNKLFTWAENNPRQTDTDERDDKHKKYSEAFIKRQFQNWPQEKWTGAGYSFPAKNEVCTKIKAQNEGYKDRLFFAGEHTCIAFVGYMEGALRSGVTVAKRIAGV